MKVTVIEEAGFLQALFGLGLSHGITSEMTFQQFHRNAELVERMIKVANANAGKDGGHNKFLEHIELWIDIDAPRYWWSQADTYRHASKQSESTMHTLMKRPLVDSDFEKDEDGVDIVHPFFIGYMNYLIASYPKEGSLAVKKYHIRKMKANLPEGFLQRRETKFSYKTFRNIYHQRMAHKLPEWENLFLDAVMTQIKFPAYITAGFKEV